MWSAAKYEVGDYVALLSNDFIIDDIYNILGEIKADGSRNIGKVIAKEEYCLIVQHGGEKKTGRYDAMALGYVLVRINPDSTNKSGVLGSNPKKVGIIVDWDNFQTGKAVTVKSGSTDKAYNTSVYDPSDLIFEVNTVRTVPTEYYAALTGGGRKRTTLRRNRVKRYFTRMAKRV